MAEIIKTFEAKGQLFTISDDNGTQKITDASGNIAFRWYQPGNYSVPTGDPKRPLMFHTWANISLCWVQPDLEQKAIAHTAGCCGRRQRAAHYANESDVRRWTNRGGS